MNQDHSNGWKYIPGSLDNVSQGGGWVWGVNSSHNVYRCKQPCDGKWILDTVGIKEDTGGSIGSRDECGNAAAKIYGKEKVFKRRGTQSGGWSWVPPGCTVQSGGDWAPHWNTRSGTCKSDSVYTCVKNKKKSYQVPSLVQLSCSNTHVYGIDTAKRAWRKNIDGSGEWTQFGNPNNRPDLTGKWSYTNMQGGGVLPVRCNPSKTNTVLCAAAAGATADQQGCGWGQYSASTPVTTKYTYETGCPGWADTSGKGVCEKLNCNTLGFSWINASSSDGKVLAIGTDRIIYETDKNGTTPWKRSSSAGGASGITTISGDSQNKDFYFTNTNDQIYKNSPITSGGYWTDIKNENYMAGALSDPKSSNDNWKYLGQGKNIDECKVKAVQDKETAYSTVVYNTGTDTGRWGQTCYGGVKGGVTNPQYQSGITTSLAPNGTSRLGGEAGNKILKEMKKIQNQIKKLAKQSEKDNIGLQKSKQFIKY